MDLTEHSQLTDLAASLALLASQVQASRDAIRPLLPDSQDSAATPSFVVRSLEPLDEVERRYVAHVLTLFDNNKTRAAQVLDVDASTLHRKLARWAEEAALRDALSLGTDYKAIQWAEAASWQRIRSRGRGGPGVMIENHRRRVAIVAHVTRFLEEHGELPRGEHMVNEEVGPLRIPPEVIKSDDRGAAASLNGERVQLRVHFGDFASEAIG